MEYPTPKNSNYNYRMNEAKQKNRLAMRLQKGDGMPVDEERARQLFREAAMAGDPSSQRNLGFRLARGECGFEKNPIEAVEWYEKAANQNYDLEIKAKAKKDLGLCYMRGSGVPLNIEQCRMLLQEASDLGEQTAKILLESHPKLVTSSSVVSNPAKIQITANEESPPGYEAFKLGQKLMHAQNGYSKDEALAAAKYKEAAEDGYADAAFEFGQCLRFARGVKQDDEQAAYWLAIAEKAGVRYAAESLAKIRQAGHSFFESKSEDFIRAVEQKPNDFMDAAIKILNERDLEKRSKEWQDLGGEFASEKLTAKDGGVAFHIGALALAGCSNANGEPDLFNALYWFKESKKLAYLWGALGVALIDRSEDRKSAAEALLLELDRKNQSDIEALNLHSATFANHIEKYFGKLQFARVFRAFFLRRSDPEKAMELLEEEANTDDILKQTNPESPLNNDECSRALAWLLWLKFKNIGVSEDSILDDLENKVTELINFTSGLSNPDQFSRNILSSANGCLAEIREQMNGVVARQTEQRMVAFQSHTMKNSLINVRHLIQDIREWLQSEPKNVPLALAALESDFSIVRNMIDANDLFVRSYDQFMSEWELDNKREISIAQIICEATQQAVIRVASLVSVELGSAKLARKMNSALVGKSASDIALLDFSENDNQSKLVSGFRFPSPFEYIQVVIDNDIDHYFGSDGIRRRFFFALVNELAFNAIKYDSGTGNIEISAHHENGNFILSCKNTFCGNGNSDIPGTRRGLGYLHQIIKPLESRGATLKTQPQDAQYIAQLNMPRLLLSAAGKD